MPLNTQIYTSDLVSETIKNIIFDLGGVLFNIEPERTAEAFAALSNSSPVDIMELHKSQNFFTDYEKGLIGDHEFRDHIREFLNKELSDKQIDDAWGALLLDIPMNKIAMIKEAGQNHRTFLLSNTNNIHRIKFEADFIETAGNRIQEYFEKVYYSFEMGMRKPDAEIFLEVLNKNDLNPEESLLIDDSLPNILSAEHLGMRTIHVPINKTVIEIQI